MTRVLVAVAFVLFLLISPGLIAQSRHGNGTQTTRDHVITVSRGGEAHAKPDLGILMMSIRSTAPITEEAVAENGRKAKAVEEALSNLGFTPQGYKITPVTFGQAGAARFGPSQPDITAYEALQHVYAFFEGADLTDVANLTQKSAAVIEALRKAGAVPANVGGPRLPTVQAGLIIYTVKDSAPYEKRALQQAIARAKDAAQDIAKGTGVEITGLRNVNSTFLYGNYGPRSGAITLEGLPYRFYSTKSDEVEIGASATVEYDFK